jgi:SSS family solute:Na+ symporter
MNMHALDWAMVAGLLLVLIWAALGTRRYSRSVAGFLAAERCGGRYLISVATGIASLGVITLVGFFEQNYDVGYTSIWWPLMEGPAWIIMGLSGWVIYRYRQTRALTLAQFFEMRYSRRFRIFAGLVAYLSGIINFGIFPAISAHFFMAVCGLPERFSLAGIECSTFALLMLGLIGTALFFTFVGGQIAVMVTDFLQGSFTNIAFVILILFLLLFAFRWDQIAHTLLAAPAGRSLVHPLNLSKEQQFNFWYYLIGVFTMFYAAMAWQGTQGYNSAARNPHEAKMAGILSGWRWRVLMLIVLVMPICARTLLEHPDFANQAADVQSRVEAVHGRTAGETETLRNQLRTPLTMAVIFPTGLLGLACAAALAAHIGTHGTYLHSWGSIFVQDVVLPFRRTPLPPATHLWLLRLSICGVAAFVFLFSLLFPLAQYILMFCALTAAIFVGGAGSVIIGGLYWKRGTTAAAWAAMLIGMATAGAGIVIKQIDAQHLEALRSSAWYGWAGTAALFVQHHLSGQVLSFCAMASSIAAYVLVSLLGPRAVFDMDRLLHRGKHAIAGDSLADASGPRGWWEKLGFTREFSGRDRIITYITLGWPLFWTIVFLVVTGYNLLVDVPEATWLAFWRVWTWFILASAVAVTAWFTIGGFRDLRELYRLLRLRRDNPLDDGRVTEPAPGRRKRALVKEHA